MRTVYNETSVFAAFVIHYLIRYHARTIANPQLHHTKIEHKLP